MVDRKKLRELIGNVQDEGVSYVDCFSDTDKPEYISNDELARYLISRGVRFETKQATSDKTSDSKWISEAISHFKYGVTHDIFKEPVTTYARLAVEALEKWRNNDGQCN